MSVILLSWHFAEVINFFTVIYVCLFVYFFFFYLTGGKGAKTEGGGAGDDELVPSRLDIRVGKIISVEKVEDKDNHTMSHQMIKI